MLDIYIKNAIIHQFLPTETELVLSDKYLNLTPKIEAYLRKKIERVYSDQAKTGVFETENAFLSRLTDDLQETSREVAQAWKDVFTLSENQKTNDLVFIEFESHGVKHFAFLRLALRENLAHLGQDFDNPITTTQNNLPGPGSPPDEALIVNLKTRQYFLIEKRIKHNGAFLNYFSDQILAVKPDISVQKSIKTMEQTAQKIAANFNQDDFQFQSKVKTALHKHLQEEEVLSAEKLADQLFDQNLTAKLSFIDQVKETLPQSLPIEQLDTSRQLKKLENQKLSLSNGIELIVPNRVYEDAESVEFIQNEDGTYSILIKNIEAIEAK